ncbi:MAG: outer membrane beta-barrel protein [Flavisolibacter sp.]
MRKLTLLALSLFFVTALFAQGSIKGLLVDTTNKAPLALATVTVFHAADTSLITYRLSNPEGVFNVPGLPLQQDLRLVISYSGYEVVRKEFQLDDEKPLDFDSIIMTPTAASLEEILVIAERPPVTVKKDTIEFNASSFKTLPTALVEDLLKKLPGVQVEKDGSITANGRRVNRIMVDGKSFFGDDPKMATRNLPANVIDKVQVTNDQEEIDRNVTGDLTNVGQVINLTLKKGVKKGWFGKLYAGAGTRDRYEAGGIANIYRDTLQLSLLAFSNNMNRSGFSFSEIQNMGGFNRSGANSIMISNRGGQTGFSINGISFGGLDQGLTRTTGAGFNLNHAPNKKNSFFLQYFYGNSNNVLEQTQNIKQFLTDTILNTRTEKFAEKNGNTHNASGGFKLNPDSLTNIQLRSNFSYTRADQQGNDVTAIENLATGPLSNGIADLFNNSNAAKYNHNFFATRKSAKKKGRSINISNNVAYNNEDADNRTEAINEYYNPFATLELNQLRRQLVPRLQVRTGITLAEPLSEKITLRWSNQHEYVKDKNDVSTFLRNANGGKYDVLNNNLSSGFERRQNRFSSGLAANIKIKDVTVTAGLKALWQNIDNSYRNISTPVRYNLFDVLPSVSLQWKQLSGGYEMDVQAPNVNYLIPVPDSSNPYNIRLGNPYLSPSRQHFFYLYNFSFLQSSSSAINFWFNGNFTDNDVVMRRRIAANGVQVSDPVNVNGSLGMNGGVGFGREFKNNQKFIFSFRISPNFNYNRSKLLVNDLVGVASSFDFGPSFNIGLNWNDIVEFNPSFRPGFRTTKYRDVVLKDIMVNTQSLESELIIRWPKKLVWETNLMYSHASDAAPGLPATNVLWNAAVTYLMFKGDVGMLKFSVFDLLDRNNGYNQYTNLNQIIDNNSNVLKRFAALSFTYNIRNMGAAKKVGGRDRLFIF